LHAAQLQNVDLTGAILRDADLHSANLDHARLNSADLRDARLYWATAREAGFDGADLSNAHFDNVRADGTRFIGARLVRAAMIDSHLTDADLRTANLTGTDLSYADLTGADLTRATIDDISVKAAIIENVRGLDPTTQRRLRAQAGRWWHDLAAGIGSFLQNWSFRLHLALTPLTVVLAAIGFYSRVARTSFAVLAVANILAVFPLLIGLIVAMFGGSPTAQMSDPALWSAWFHLWPTMLIGLLALFVASVGAGGHHLVRYVIMKPRNRWIISLTCATLTVANCFFACYALLLMAPDA
jgi:hypothetical protein